MRIAFICRKHFRSGAHWPTVIDLRDLMIDREIINVRLTPGILQEP